MSHYPDNTNPCTTLAVEQCDREAAAEVCGPGGIVLDGGDFNRLVQAFARHRTSSPIGLREALDKAWEAYQSTPIDLCADSDDETRKCVENAVKAVLSSAPALQAGQSDLTELVEAVEPFSVALGNIADTDRERWPDNETIEHSGAAEEITWGDLRRARAVLAKHKAQPLTEGGAK